MQTPVIVYRAVGKYQREGLQTWIVDQDPLRTLTVMVGAVSSGRSAHVSLADAQAMRTKLNPDLLLGVQGHRIWTQPNWRSGLDCRLDFYLLTDELFDEPGQWFAIWPVAEVVARNLEAYAVEGRSRGAYTGFGDDGTGDPFCLPRDGGRGLFQWSPIDQRAALLHDDVASLVAGWTGDKL